MKLSDTQRIVLSHGAQHPQLLTIAPKHLPVAACRAVVNSLIKSRLLIEVAAPRDQLAMVWRKDADGTPILIQLGTDGRHASLGRTEPSEAEITAAGDALAAQGLSGWLARMQGEYYSRGKVTLEPLQPIGIAHDADWQVTLAAFHSARHRAIYVMA